jgi:hypothetical protein
MVFFGFAYRFPSKKRNWNRGGKKNLSRPMRQGGKQNQKEPSLAVDQADEGKEGGKAVRSNLGATVLKEKKPPPPRTHCEQISHILKRSFSFSEERGGF